MVDKRMSSRTLSATFRSSGASPCSEEEEEGVYVMAKGWSSERVPLHRRHVAAAALMPFGSGSSGSGRAFPSKWDDAERWISSSPWTGTGTAPNNYYYATGVQIPHNKYQRRAKSKSGPLGPGSLNSYGFSPSPVLGMGVINGGTWRNSVAVESPASVHARLHQRIAAAEAHRRSFPGHPADPDWHHLWSTSSTPTTHLVNPVAEKNTESLEEINNHHFGNENGETAVDGTRSRRDMATQMYPDSESSSHSSVVSSPRSSISDNSPLQPMPDDHLNNRSNDGNNIKSPEYESEVRDVQIDKQTSTSRISTSNCQGLGDHPDLDSVFVEADNRFSKLEKEEARINAWENLQKAKAEAAIQKLEMKLEKQRASAMEKIIEKVRRAEIKAEKMRCTISTGNTSITSDEAQSQSRAISRTTSKIPSFCKKFRLISSKTCTTCYPF